MPQRIVVVPARHFKRFINRADVQAVIGALVIAMAFVVAYLAKQSYDDSRDSNRAAKAACVRTKQLAPPLLEFFASFDGTSHALSASALRQYRLTVPKTCPK